MAQTGYTPILIYSSSTTSNTPAAGNLTNSTLGSELAINITDGKLFYKDNANAVQVIGWKTTPTSAGGTGLTSYSAGDTLYYASGTALSKLAIGSSGYYMSSSGTAPQWNAPAALTKTDDTNVTLTLGGSASTALLNAASLTLGWTGQLAASRGGTGIGTYTAGDILYASGTTTLSKLGIGANTTVLTSNGSAPQWTAASSVAIGTATNLAGGVAGSLPYQSGAGATTFLGIGAANTVLTSTGSAPQWSSTLTLGGLTITSAGLINKNNNANTDTTFLNSNTTGTGANFMQIINTGGTFAMGLENSASTYVGVGAYDFFLWGANSSRAISLGFGGVGTTAKFFGSGGVSIGNTTDPGATNLSVSGNILSGTTSSGGSLSNTKSITGGLFQTLSGTTASLANGATEDISNLTSGAAYLVTCRGSTNTTTFVIHTVYVNGAGGITLATLSNGNGFVLSSPSNNTLRVTGLVTTQTYPYTLTRIF